MKITQIASIVLLGLVAQASAVIVSIGNANFQVAFTDNSGVPLAANTGVVSAGIFTDPNAISIDTINTNFVGLVNPVDPADSTFSVNAPSGQDGVLSGSIDGGRQAAGPFVGANIFFVVGNGDSLLTSTEFAVLDTGETFDADLTTPTPSTIAFTPTADSIVIGSQGEPVLLFGGQLTAPLNVQLAAIPEPSSTLLAGLALIGGLVRRRR